MSINHVWHRNALAVGYLFFAACVEWKDISLDLFELALLRTKEDGVKVLIKYALVTRRPADSALDLHRLVHRFLRERL